ncbi:MAG: SH3 domain-containing protein [Bdellovibrionota bacterium]
MRSTALIFLLHLLVLGGFEFAHAAQSATVVTDGAMVYKKGDFDAAVVGYMRAGEKVRVSSKKFGPFYRIQFKQGVIGYISDVDVDVGGISSDLPTSAKSKGGSEGRARSFISKRYLGVSYGMLNYSEELSDANTVESESLSFFGVKFTMPMKYLAGPFVLDTNLLYHSGYPKYYNMTTPVVSNGISGKILMYDLQVLYSLSESTQKNFWAYVGGGIAMSYSSFMVEINGSKKDLSDVLFGGVITGGIAYRMNKVAIKLEPKYYAMKSNYLAFIGSVQYEF